MKILHYRRHSIKDGEIKDTIGPKGIALAITEGEKGDEGIPQSDPAKPCLWYNKGFHGSLVRTCQTLYAFAHGLGYTPDPMPAVEKIGTGALLAEISTPKFLKMVESGASYFEAVLAAHDKTKVKEWDGMALTGVRKMFEAMADGEAAIAFGHSPIIELAAWTLCGSALPKYNRDCLMEMEGIVFVMNDKGGIYVDDEKITVTF